MTYRNLINTPGNGNSLVIMQFFGLGDVIFCQRLAQIFHLNGWRVLWPVMPEFVEGLNRAYPPIAFMDYNLMKIDWNRKFIHQAHGATVVPLRWSYDILRVPFKDCMKSKYKLFGLDWEIWKDGAMWNRDHDKEQRLLKKLNPNGHKFNLINRNFRTNHSGVVDIAVNNGLMNIEMKRVAGYSLFDWAGVMEAATEIHTVSTSILYVLEVLGLSAHYYIRRPDEKSHVNYDYLLSKNNYLHA